MNHDFEHCIDFNDGCPESCFRAQLVRDLEQNYPPSMEVSWMNFGDFPDCQRNRLANSSPKLENENGDTISRQAAIDALKRVPGVGNRALDKIRELPPAHTEIIYCKDCRKHNIKVGFDENFHTVWKEDACPLVSWRGKAKGHEFDYQYCAFAENRDGW